MTDYSITINLHNPKKKAEPIKTASIPTAVVSTAEPKIPEPIPLEPKTPEPVARHNIHTQDYIVHFKSTITDVTPVISELEKKYKIKPSKTFEEVFAGFTCQIPDRKLATLLTEDSISFIEKDNVINAAIYDVNLGHEAIQINIYDDTYNSQLLFGNLWNHVICNTVPALTDDFSSIHCYVFDTGILSTHPEFDSGQVLLDYNAISNKSSAVDDNGHGTAVASIIAGKNVGGAIKTKLHAVKVLDSRGSGLSSYLLAGIDWVLKHKNNDVPCVMNFSLNGLKSLSVNTAIQKCIDNNICVIVAAGNASADSCLYSPSGWAPCITASAYDSSKKKPSWANFGSCVDIFTPGVNMKSAWLANSYATVSGTSFSAPMSCAIAIRYIKKKNTPAVSNTDLTSYFNISSIKGDITGVPVGTPNVRAVWNPDSIPVVC